MCHGVPVHVQKADLVRDALSAHGLERLQEEARSLQRDEVVAKQLGQAKRRPQPKVELEQQLADATRMRVPVLSCGELPLLALDLRVREKRADMKVAAAARRS